MTNYYRSLEQQNKSYSICINYHINKINTVNVARVFQLSYTILTAGGEGHGRDGARLGDSLG
jgi:hypothetical protein